MTDTIQTTKDMSYHAREVVRILGWKTKAGIALRRRDEIASEGRDAIVVFKMPVGWHVQEKTS